MLTGEGPEGIHLISEKKRIGMLLPGELKKYLVTEDRVSNLVYPVEQYPEKVRSLNFDKEPEVSGVLTGIKGQYLMFGDNRVINLRKFGGYLVLFRWD